MNSLLVGGRESNLHYTGFGTNHKNLCETPFSAFPGFSIIARENSGWLNPPTVRLVDGMEKFASPVTEEITKL